METTTLKEVEGAMPVKNDFKYVRGLDNQGGQIKIGKDFFYKRAHSKGSNVANWHRMAKYSCSNLDENTDVAFILHNAFSNIFAIFVIESRSQNYLRAYLISSYKVDRNRIRIYHNSDKTEVEIYYYDGGSYDAATMELIYARNRTGSVIEEINLFRDDTTPPSFETFTNPTFQNLQCRGIINEGDLYLINKSHSCALVLSDHGENKTFAPHSNSAGGIDLGNGDRKFRNLYLLGQVFQSSDETLKDIVDNVTIPLENIANTPNIKFKWKPKEEDIQTLEEPAEPKEDKIHIGTTAQYIKSVLPELVTGDEGNLSVDYATTALVFATQTAKHLESSNRKIADLEARIAKLEGK